MTPSRRARRSRESWTGNAELIKQGQFIKQQADARADTVIQAAKIAADEDTAIARRWAAELSLSLRCEFSA